MTGPDLKPCPFCGVRPHVHDDASHSTAFFAGCYNDNCPVQPSAYGLSRAEAITAWNTRAQVDYAALPEVQALIAGALQSIADKAKTEICAAWASDLIAQWVRNVTPADALAARDAMIAEAVKAEREACAKDAEDNSVPGMYQAAPLPFLAGYEDACQSIAAAIRKRGEG